MANTVFIVRNTSTANVELKDFGFILSPSINTELEIYDRAVLSTELNNYLASGTLIRVINGTDVSYNQAFALSAPIYNLDASLSVYATNASVGLAIAPFATNASVGTAIAPFATNASVGLAIAPFATNASIGLAGFATNSSVNIALGPFATNASVGLAIAPFATNASVGLAIAPFATNASVGLAVAPFATNASVGLAVAPFATNSSVGIALTTLNSSVNTALGAYATNASVNTALGAYTTNASIGIAAFAKNASFNLYATNSSVGLAIAPFATNASVGLAIAPFATNSSVGTALTTLNSSVGTAIAPFATNASVGLAIAPFATNASVGTAIAPFATNASVGLAIQNFATNSSVNTALGAYATNASVGLAIAPFATNASVGLALGKYVPNASLGLDFYWDPSHYLNVSIGAILTTGKNLTIDASGNIAVVNSPNFSGDVSIQGNLFTNQKIEFSNFSISNASVGDLWYQSPRLFFRDGSANRDLLQGALKGNVYPASPSEGDIYYRTDQGLQYIYDSSRGKYLAANRVILTCGRTSAVAGTTTYMRVGDATQSTTAGFKMFRNGTILGFSVDQNNTLTAPRDMQIRINDVSSLTKTIIIGGKSVYYTQGNVDFAEGDLLQVLAIAGDTGSALNNIIAIVEIGWRV